ncbi:MAG: DinB family protein [Bryobacteraceae bacterium]
MNPYSMEFEQEAAATGRLLQRVPEERLPWRPHQKSMSLGELALHVATIPASVAELLGGDGVEAASLLVHPEARSVSEIGQAWERTLATTRALLSSTGDDHEPWSIRKGGQPALTIPKGAARRMLMLNHWYHHRGQLTVYLRLLDVPVPSVYGASADENPFA